MKRRSTLATLLLIFLALSSRVIARDWYEYKTDNFTVYSDVSEKRVENLLRDMERFRNAVLFFTGLKDRPENQKLLIFHFNSSGEFKKFSGNHRIAGFYRNTWDGPLIFSQRSSGGLTGEGIMYHEYVHHLMRERSNMSYPMWYSEGFAELLASADIRKGKVMIGNAPEWRISALDGSGRGGRPLTVSDLLQPDFEKDSTRYWNSYYATAWLFTHYLQLGALSDNASYSKQTRSYLLAVNEGADPLESFEQHYGKTVDEMQGELKRYMRDRLYGYKFDIPAYEKETQRRKLDDNERYFLLAEKALDMGNEELALEYLEESKSKSAGWQANLSLTSVLRNHAENGSAHEGIERVEAGQVTDYRSATNLAHYYADRLDSLKKDGHWDDELYRKALKYGQAAIELNPTHLPAYRYVWIAQQYKGDKVAALKTMMAAFQQDSGSLYLNESIGFYLAAIDRSDLARPFLERVVAWSHAGETRSEAKRILDSLGPESAPHAAGGEAAEKESG